MCPRSLAGALAAVWLPVRFSLQLAADMKRGNKIKRPQRLKELPHTSTNVWKNAPPQPLRGIEKC